jgi:hypothetical protein
VLIATSSPANVYATGGTVVVTTPIKGDLSAAGGSVTIDASIAGDALLAGGSVRLASPVAGDARMIGGRVSLTDTVGGDLFSLAGSFSDTGGGATHTFIIAGDAQLLNGSNGPVTIFGSTITLGGTFTSDVDVVAGTRLSLLPDTVIRGELRYQAPEQASISATAKIIGGVRYTGASYLPTSEEARAIAFASFGVFLFVKILGSLILAGLIAGLFPLFALQVVEHATRGTLRRKFLTLLLGFGVVVAAPVFMLILAITFVGLGLAGILLLLYLLLVPLAFIYSAIVCGSYLARYIFKRTSLLWSDAALGMLVYSLVASLPYVGWLISLFAIVYLVGVLITLIYRFVLPRDTELA